MEVKNMRLDTNLNLVHPFHHTKVGLDNWSCIYVRYTAVKSCSRRSYLYVAGRLPPDPIVDPWDCSSL